MRACILVIGFLLCVPAFTAALSADCKCTHVPVSETTHRGQEIITFTHTWRVNNLRGIALAGNGTPMSDVLVEAFDHPETMRQKDDESNKAYRERRQQQRRVAACKTGADGKFCFAEVTAGKYELRLSTDGYNTPSLPVRVIAQNTRVVQEKIKVFMEVSH